MSMEFITPVDICPATTGWQVKDVSAYIPVGATGVILHLECNVGACGYRKNGSTDTHTYAGTAGHAWALCGVDNDRKLSLRRGSIIPKVWLIGYIGSEVEMFTNAIDKSLSIFNTWTDIDISSHCADTAIAGIFNIVDTQTATYDWGLRMNGSSDDRIQECSGYRNSVQAIIGVDTSEICEGYTESQFMDFYLVGYFKQSGAEFTFNLNAMNVSLSTTDSWTDLVGLPAGLTKVIIEVVNTSTTENFAYGLRKDGDSEDIYIDCARHNWAIIQASSEGKIKGKIETTSIDFYIIAGYSIPAENYTYLFH